MTGGEYAALAYGVVLVVVLGYVAIIAAKLQRLQRDVSELGELAKGARMPADPLRGAVYAARVPSADEGHEEAT